MNGKKILGIKKMEQMDVLKDSSFLPAFLLPPAPLIYFRGKKKSSEAQAHVQKKTAEQTSSRFLSLRQLTFEIAHKKKSL